MPDPIDPAVLDRFTRLAEQVLDVPVVSVSLLDEHRRRMVRSHDRGVGTATARETACGVALDAQLSVHAAIRLVTSDGRRVGTLTVMDRKSRRWSASQLEFLKELSLRLVGEVDIGPVERVM